ncbi:hypothetical protein C8R41DRAFT_273550 [Lentinula lateritia]|uniref:Uncharacterized protein n=1 Tax=Lentinula lateritia TaxID=40482 RepID=A0ABQ8VIU8_9AGAR|nr:hypothetical protein C8R41DRAFT_273550 [Lentinula lateritia]
MCRYRQVQNTYSRCGHVIREPDVLVRTWITECNRILYSHVLFRYHVPTDFASSVLTTLQTVVPIVPKPVGNIVNFPNNIILWSTTYAQVVTALACDDESSNFLLFTLMGKSGNHSTCSV